MKIVYHQKNSSSREKLVFFRKIKTFLETGLEKILDILFPREKRAELLEKISPEEFWEKCKKAKTVFERTEFSKKRIALFDYKDPLVREAIWQVKYKGNKKVTRLLAHLLYDVLIADLEDLGLFSDFEKPIIIPAPISKRRLHERGFNQTELLVKALSFIDVSHVFTHDFSVLYKIKDTPSQTSLKDKRKRMKNVRDCFKVKNPEKIKNKNIIILHDVSTTGSTLYEIEKVLHKAGAKNIVSITIAH